MKKLLFSILSTALVCSSIPAYASDITVLVNGTPITSDVAAQSIDGYTMIPLRAICDALDAKTDWDKERGEITITNDSITNQLKIGDRYAYVTKNGKTDKVLIPIAPVVKNGRTLVPIRFVSETLGTEVVWVKESKTVQIRSQEDIAKPIAQMGKFTLKTKWHTLTTGENIETLTSEMGRPDRIEKGILGLTWYIYNHDYEEFLMVAVENDIICGFYTNTAEFSVNDSIFSGQTDAKATENMTLYYDKFRNDAVYAVFVYPKNYISQDALAYEQSEEYLDIQSRIASDCINSFRVANGLKPLVWDDLLAKTAKLHAVDMADQNYFDHISLDNKKPNERYYANGGTSYQAYGEIIAAGGRSAGMDVFDKWLNSEGHRNNMLFNEFTAMGIGGGYDPSSKYQYYFATNFKG